MYMMGFSLGMGGMGQQARGEPDQPVTPPATIRIVPVSATEAFAVAPHPDGALALHLIHGNGANPVDQNPAASLGAPFGGWRIRGYRFLADTGADPRTQAVETIYDGVGSQEYAINVQNIYGGTYHGGLGAYTQTGPDCVVAGTVAEAKWDHAATITWGTGEVATITGSLELLNDGRVRTTHRMVMPHNTLTAAMSLLMVGGGFTRASLDGGATWQNIGAVATYPASGASEVWFRHPGTGTVVRAVDTAAQAGNFLERNFDTTAERVKLRTRLDTPNGGPFGDRTVTATYSFHRGAADPAPPPPPPQTFTGFTETFDAAEPANPRVPLGWLFYIDNGQPSAIAGGSWSLSGNGTVGRLVLRASGKVLPPGTYRVEVDYSTATAQSTGTVAIASNDTGSGSTSPAHVQGPSLNSTSPTTQVLTCTIPAGQQGWLTVNAVTTASRQAVFTEMRVIRTA